jgi:hypothetical protein
MKRASRCTRASSARSRSSWISCRTNPGSVGTAANRSIAPCASGRSVSRPLRSRASTRTVVAGAPYIGPPSANAFSRAARDSWIASSRSPARAFSLAKTVSMTLAAGKVKRSCNAASRAVARRARPASLWGPSWTMSERPCTHRAQVSVKSSPDRSEISSSSAVSCRAAASGSNNPLGMVLKYLKNRISARIVASNARTIVAASSISRLQPGSPSPHRAHPRSTIAAANGEPRMRFPLDGSPSARSIMRCANRRVSASLPVWSLTTTGA